MGQGRHGYVNQADAIETPDGGDNLAVFRISDDVSRDLYAKFSDGTEKQYTGSGSGAILTANNALTKTGANVAFGGPLVANTVVAMAGFNTDWTGNGTIMQKSAFAATGANTISGAGTYFGFQSGTTNLISAKASAAQLDTIFGEYMFIGGNSNQVITDLSAYSFVNGNLNVIRGISHSYLNGSTNTINSGGQRIYNYISGADNVLSMTTMEQTHIMTDGVTYPLSSDLSYCQILGEGGTFAQTKDYCLIYNHASSLLNANVMSAIFMDGASVITESVVGSYVNLNSSTVPAASDIFYSIVVGSSLYTGASGSTSCLQLDANNSYAANKSYSYINSLTNQFSAEINYSLVTGTNSSFADDVALSLAIGSNIVSGGELTGSVFVGQGVLQTGGNVIHCLNIGSNTYGSTVTSSGMIGQSNSIVAGTNQSFVVGDSNSFTASVNGSIVTSTGSTFGVLTDSAIFGANGVVLDIASLTNSLYVGDIGVTGAGKSGVAILGVGSAAAKAYIGGGTGILTPNNYTTYFENMATLVPGGSINLVSPDGLVNADIQFNNSSNLLIGGKTLFALDSVGGAAPTANRSLIITVGSQSFAIAAELL